ncbi:MAG: hypothetical protein ACJA08_002348 [Cyclobacteriaceae bacterium]|jgi:hypothetical protein
MKDLLIEPHYLGCLEYFTLLTAHKKVIFEVNQHYIKQTYKNRCYILTAQGKLSLTIPVQFDNRTIFKDVKIDYNQSWIREHWGAVYSAYGKSPFFEYFSDYFKSIWDKKHTFLVDLNMDFLTLCLKLLQIDIEIQFTETYHAVVENNQIDNRETINPKKETEFQKTLRTKKYNQNFGNEFVPNLAILDLLFCEGTEALNIIRA